MDSQDTSPGAGEVKVKVKVTDRTVLPPQSSTPSKAKLGDKVNERLCERIRQLEVKLEKGGKPQQVYCATYTSHLSLWAKWQTKCSSFSLAGLSSSSSWDQLMAQS